MRPGPFAPHFVVVLIDGGSPPTPLFTRDRLDVRVVDLPPCRDVDVEFRLDGGFLARGRFRSSPGGAVSTTTDAPSAGTWAGVHPDGPFFSSSNGGAGSPTTHDLVLTGRWDGGAPFTAFVPRAVLPPGTVVTSFRETTAAGLYADFYRPPGPGPFPGVVVFGGSEGGLGGGQLTGQGLVREGFAVLAVAYWGVPGKPSGMSRIPLETFQRAVARLRQLPDVQQQKVALLGVSRGGEAALLAGSSFPADVQAVVALVPSGFAWAAPGSSTTSTWTLDGGDVPFLAWPTGSSSVITRDAGYQVTFSAPFFLGGYEAARDAGLAGRAQIAVENVNGPVLMLAAGDDGVWPSCALTSPAWERLVDAGHALARGDQFVCFPGAGHSINPSRAGFPLADLIDRGTASTRSGYGGSASTDNDVNHALWPLIRGFLADALR
ncbi:MAG: acyl-CoA thioesterase/BAAT N-terminal domain-containing protein [Myxococcaceae bacterium]|nr:acyl-CoA thioesterase/BAAT N-terminal domain-containing protein [Myxococcaceae bacterium]